MADAAVRARGPCACGGSQTSAPAGPDGHSTPTGAARSGERPHPGHAASGSPVREGCPRFRRGAGNAVTMRAVIVLVVSLAASGCATRYATLRIVSDPPGAY